MFDELEASGNVLDVEQLSAILRVPCVPTIGNRGKGVTELISTALKAARGEVPALGHHPIYSHEMEHALDAVVSLIQGKTPYNERWTAVNLLQFGETSLPETDKITITPEIFDEVDSIRSRVESIEKRNGNLCVSGSSNVLRSRKDR